MRFTAAILLLLLLLSACGSGPPPAAGEASDRGWTVTREPGGEPHPRTATTPVAGDLRAFGSVGLTADPSTFLLDGGADYYVGPDWTVGGLLQLGVESNDTIVATSSQLKRVFALGTEAEPSRWRPWLEAGLGLVYLRRAERLADKDGFGFVLNAGGGLQYRIDDGVDVSTGVLFNVVPAEVAGEHFFFSWQIVQMGFWF